jgi:hypothetical protein
MDPPPAREEGEGTKVTGAAAGSHARAGCASAAGGGSELRLAASHPHVTAPWPPQTSSREGASRAGGKEGEDTGVCWWKSGPKVDANTTAPWVFLNLRCCYEATSTNSRRVKETRKYLTDQEMK